VPEEEKQVEKESLAAMEDKLCEATEEQLTVSEGKAESPDKADGQLAESPDKAEGQLADKAEGQGPVPDLVPDMRREEQAAPGSPETDSLKDLDIVAVSEAQCSEPVCSHRANPSPARCSGRRARARWRPGTRHPPCRTPRAGGPTAPVQRAGSASPQHPPQNRAVRSSR
jgi:hypothetical protein